ncbi:MAG: GNAT family N-acetyltransferase [Actinomycetota bacterium]
MAIERVPESPVHGELTSIRPATEDDVDLLVRWHLDPEVARYWDEETYTHEQMRDELARADVDAYIIESDEGPIGYLQAWFADDAAEESGLDMFLIPEARGRGLGPDAANALARWLVSTLQLPRLIVDPYLSNPQGIRAWTKAGFEPVGERPADQHRSEPWLLMVFVPPAGAEPR